MSVFKVEIYYFQDIRFSPELLWPYMVPESEFSLRSSDPLAKVILIINFQPRYSHISSLIQGKCSYKTCR